MTLPTAALIWPRDWMFLALAGGLLTLFARSRDRVRSAAVVYVVSLTLVDLPVARHSVYGALTLFGIALVLLALAFFAEGRVERAVLIPTLRLFAPLGLLIAWSALGCWRAGGNEWNEWGRLLRLILTALMVCLAARRTAVRQAMAAAFVATLSVLAALAMVQFAWGRFVFGIGRTTKAGYDYFIEATPGLVRASGTFEDPNNLGIFAGVALLLVAHRFFLAGAHGPGRRVALLLAPLLLLGMACSLTRSAALAAILGLIVLWPRQRTATSVRALVALSLVVVAAVLLARGRTVVPERFGSVQHRLLYWRAAVEMTRQQPLMGIGLGRFADRLLSVEPDLPPKVAAFGAHRPHNFVLQLAAETGLVGLLLFLAYLAPVAAALIRRRDPTARLGQGLLFAVLFHGSLHNILLQDLFWLICGVAGALALTGDEDSSSEKKPPFSGILARREDMPFENRTRGGLR